MCLRFEDAGKEAMHNRMYIFVRILQIYVTYWWQNTVVVVVNRAVGNVPFSLKFQGTETLTPKECCDGSEILLPCGILVLFLWVRHTNSAHLWQINLLVWVTQARRYWYQRQELRDVEGACGCVIHAEVPEPQSQFPIWLLHACKKPGTAWDSPQENPLQFVFVN